MILLRFGERPLSGPSYSAVGRSVRVTPDGVYICHEVRDAKSGEWVQNFDPVMGVSIVRDGLSLPEPGVYHVWHDGPHCSLWLWRLAIHWSGNPLTGKCAKCEVVT